MLTTSFRGPASLVTGSVYEFLWLSVLIAGVLVAEVSSCRSGADEPGHKEANGEGTLRQRSGFSEPGGNLKYPG